MDVVTQAAIVAQQCADTENWIRVRRSAIGDDVGALIDLLERGQCLLDDILDQRAQLLALAA